MSALNNVSEKQQDNNTKSGFVETCFEWVGAAVIALVVVSLLVTMLCRIVSVSGDSMTHTFKNGERLILSSVVQQPKYGDVVVIRREGDTPLIKRVIGLPGDKIFITEDGVVMRNDEPVPNEDKYIRGEGTPRKGMNSMYIVPEGGIFVLGDNRGDSLDSRMLQDRIRMKDVVGVVTFRLTPFEFLRNGD